MGTRYRRDHLQLSLSNREFNLTINGLWGVVLALLLMAGLGYFYRPRVGLGGAAQGWPRGQLGVPVTATSERGAVLEEQR